MAAHRGACVLTTTRPGELGTEYRRARGGLRQFVPHRCDVRGRMGGAGWARGEARVADDSDFQTLKNLLASVDGWTLEYEKEGVKVWAEDAAHGALRTVKVCFV